MFQFRSQHQLIVTIKPFFYCEVVISRNNCFAKFKNCLAKYFRPLELNNVRPHIMFLIIIVFLQ